MPQSLLDLLKSTTDCSLDRPPPLFWTMSCGGHGQHEAILYSSGGCVNVRTSTRSILWRIQTVPSTSTHTVSTVHPPGSVWCDEAVAGYNVERAAWYICALAIVCHVPCWRRPNLFEKLHSVPGIWLLPWIWLAAAGCTKIISFSG